MKLSKGLIIAIACGVAAIIAVAVILITTADPYKKAETAHFAEVLPYAANAEYFDGYSLDYNIEYNPSGDISDAFRLPFKTIGVDGEFKQNGMIQALSASLNEDGQSFLTEMYNNNAKSVLILFPGVSEYAVKAEYPEQADLPELNMSSLTKTGKKISDRYFEIAKENGTYSTAVLTNGGVDYKCDTFTLEITGGMINDFAVFTAEEIDKNETLRAYLEAAFALEDQNYGEQRDEFLSAAKDKFGGDSSEEVFLRMTVYIKNGKILGREFDNIYEFEGTTVKIYDTTAENKRAQLIEFRDETAVVAYEGDYTVDKGYLTGTAEVYYDSEGERAATAKTDVTGFKYNGVFAEGSLITVITIDTTEIVTEAVFTVNGKTQTGEFNLKLNGSNPVDFGTVSYTATLDGANPKIEMPEIDEAHTVDINEESDKSQILYADILSAAAEYNSNSIIYSLLNSLMSELYR